MLFWLCSHLENHSSQKEPAKKVYIFQSDRFRATQAVELTEQEGISDRAERGQRALPARLQAVVLAPLFGVEKQFEQTRQDSEKRKKFYPCFAHGEIMFAEIW